MYKLADGVEGHNTMYKLADGVDGHNTMYKLVDSVDGHNTMYKLADGVEGHNTMYKLVDSVDGHNTMYKLVDSVEGHNTMYKLVDSVDGHNTMYKLVDSVEGHNTMYKLVDSVEGHNTMYKLVDSVDGHNTMYKLVDSVDGHNTMYKLVDSIDGHNTMYELVDSVEGHNTMYELVDSVEGHNTMYELVDSVEGHNTMYKLADGVEGHNTMYKLSESVEGHNTMYKLADHERALPWCFPVSIILDKASQDVENLLVRMVEANNRNNSDSRIVLDHVSSIIDLHDSYKLSTAMCNQLGKGVFLLLGASAPQSFNVIQSYSQALHVPYVSYTTNRNQRADGYSYDFSVSPSYIDAVIDIIKFFRWEKVYYLFDSDDGLWQLQQLYESFPDPDAPLVVDARRVRDTEHAHDLLRRLDRVSRAERKRIILNFSSEQVYQNMLNQIVDVGMNRENYHYVLAGPDIDKLNLRSFKYGGVNVTGFRLPLSSNPLTTTFQEITTGSHTRYGVSTLSTDAALALDGLQTVIRALNSLLYDHHTRQIFKTFRHGQLYNNDTRGIQCWRQPVLPWVHGKVIKDALTRVKFKGLTGPVEYNRHGVRQNHSLEIMQLAYKSPLKKVGNWSEKSGVIMTGGRQSQTQLPANRTRVVTTILENPFLMLAKHTDGTIPTGNNRYEGYCADLIAKIAHNVQFQYVLKEVKDQSYGSMQRDGSWNGMIGELIGKEADIAVAALSITEVRERIVDFSKPFMDTGTSIMIKKPDKQHGGIFSFKSPLSDGVWLSIAFGFVAVSIVLFLVGRFSPYEWTPESRGEVPEGEQMFVTGEGQLVDPGATNPFTLDNTLWFALGALMQQGSDISPRSISGRVVGAAWWFFTLIIISSYTANLAAFLTIERMDMPINSADDLVKQREIRYGTVKNGATYQFFNESEVTVYKHMMNFMREAEPSVFTRSVEEGVKRVRESKGKYAFLLDAAMNEYHNQRKPCNTLKAGRNLDDKGYGVATPQFSDLRAAINIAVLELREVGELHKLERKWWYDKGECAKNIKESKTSSLTLSNVSGIFHILIGGLVLAMFVALLDYCIKSRLKTKKFNVRAVRSQLHRMARGRSREKRRTPPLPDIPPPLPPAPVASGKNGDCRFPGESTWTEDPYQAAL
ncbi:glutamate receptor 2-like [Babylonia areolata]|uniref:glutamate receptor 2-like n=1 Tax=Babylonia areolata TaxID=304850 RepID=UPI003FD22EF2